MQLNIKKLLLITTLQVNDFYAFLAMYVRMHLRSGEFSSSNILLNPPGASFCKTQCGYCFVLFCFVSNLNSLRVHCPWATAVAKGLILVDWNGRQLSLSTWLILHLDPGHRIHIFIANTTFAENNACQRWVQYTLVFYMCFHWIFSSASSNATHHMGFITSEGL